MIYLISQRIAEVLFTWNMFDKYEAFAALVAFAEREACAKVADEHMRECEGKGFGVGAAIRARGKA